MVWQSSEVSAGDEILAEQYNDLRDDVVEVFESAVPLGSVTMWAGDSGDVPTGWDLCDGSAISRSTYSDLYTLLGNTFGAGDGSTTFNLPDMRDRFVVGAGSSYARNAQGGSTSNDIGHTHTVNSHSHSIAQHSHTVSSHRHYTGAHSHTSGSIVAHIFRNSQYQMYLQNVSSGAWASTQLINLYNSSNSAIGHSTAVGTSGSTGSANAGYTDYQSPGTSTAGATSTGNTSPSTDSGGSSSLENRPPYIGLFYIIKVE
jgi:microcystin-dependent protein